jgi:hypothetical protein
MPKPVHSPRVRLLSAVPGSASVGHPESTVNNATQKQTFFFSFA